MSAISSKPIGSKPTAIPKPSSASKTRASSCRKRRETDSPATSEIFPYENHGFVEASGFMTSFLNQGMIAAAKSQHYEDKFRAMTLEHQADMKKDAHEAQAKLDAA
ncbi:hypothetical protein Hanom_Chr16g01491581 [Helianthus anomalus]